MVPNEKLSIRKGALAPVGKYQDNIIFMQIRAILESHGFTLEEFISWVLRVKSNIDSGQPRAMMMGAIAALTAGPEWYAGLPDEEQSEMMGTATDRFSEILDKDPVAVMTGIFTGDGVRTWVFYTLSTNIFNKKLNEAFDPLPTLPLEITAENDPHWEAYDEMAEFEVK